MLNLSLYLIIVPPYFSGVSKLNTYLPINVSVVLSFICLFSSNVSLNGYFFQYNAGQYLESFAVELVVLAIWKKALEVCNSWLVSITEGEMPGRTSAKEATFSCRDDVCISQTMEQKIDFSDPSSVSLWAKQGFIFAVDHAEKMSSHIQNMDGRTAFFFWVLNVILSDFLKNWLSMY